MTHLADTDALLAALADHLQAAGGGDAMRPDTAHLLDDVLRPDELLHELDDEDVVPFEPDGDELLHDE